MKLLFKYRDQIVSLGLLPLIATLIGLHFLPSDAVLRGGLILSITALLYYIIRLKELNFFLLLGTIGIGTCYLVREFTDYLLLPKGGVTPTLEFILLIFAFIHITAPEIYKSIQRWLKLKSCFSYLLEAKTIVVLSSLHLLILGITVYHHESLSEKQYFFFINIIPIFIYVICLVINAIGIRIAVKEDSRYSLIRVAPLCQGKIYLTQKERTVSCTSIPSAIWDLPVEKSFEGPISKHEKYVRKITGIQLEGPEIPRPILHYKSSFHCSYEQYIHLYIVPVAEEKEIHFPKGRFFSFEEIETHQEKFSPALLHELSHLQLAAHMWDEYFYNSNKKNDTI